MNAVAATLQNDALASFLAEPKTRSLAALLKSRLARAPSRILVVGCGRGKEAAVLANFFKADVTGIDPRHDFDPAAASLAKLQQGDAMGLDFPDRSFDLVYSFHALEHIADPQRALKEMRRVLQPRGHYCIGTPNRARWIGYLGSKDATFGQKIRWNFADWNARVHGRFSNELGAHAGFYRADLEHSLHDSFGTAEDITLEYYLTQYPGRTGLISALARLGVAQRLFPCVYFMGMRTT